MRADIDRMLARSGGASTRALLLRQGLSRHALDNEVRSGALVIVASSTYCRPWDAEDVDVREQAAVLSLGRATALSHLSALRRWQCPTALPHPVHVSVPARRSPGRGDDAMVVHRVSRFPPVIGLRGVITVTLPTAVVTSFPLLAAHDRRGPVIEAVRRGLVTPEQVRAAAASHPRLTGGAQLRQVIDLLAAGCESKLEMWGHLEVFDVPGLRHGIRQRIVRVGGRYFRLDLAYEQERVAVELDGRRFHSSDEQRERDIRRDALLATAGWLTLRFSYRRLHSDVAGCRPGHLGHPGHPGRAQYLLTLNRLRCVGRRVATPTVQCRRDAGDADKPAALQ